MKNNLRTMKAKLSSKAMKKGMGIGLMALCSFASVDAFAQLNYRPADAINTTTTYTDLGLTTGTVIVTTGFDDANSTAQPIGFTFNYNGQSFTEFVLNTNGFIKLGNTNPSAPTLINAIGSASAADVNIIAPSSNIDLQGAADQVTTPTEYRVATTGTAPDRVTTIQFKNVADKATVSGTTTIPAQFTTMEFQIKLYETTNNIEFVYGTWVANTAAATGQPFIIGLKGSSNAPINRLMAYKPSSFDDWTTTTFVTGDPTSPNNLVAHFIRNAVAPDPGRTYRFVPVTIHPIDASVHAVFTMGKIATTSGTPHSVSARIRNVGSSTLNNYVVTLTVTGANPFTTTRTISNLPSGADSLVTFAPYTPTATGTNNITVSVPADGDNTNNSKTMTQFVTANTMSYADFTTTPVNIVTAIRPVGTPTTTTVGKLLAKFRASSTEISVPTVRVYIPGAGFNPAVNNVGKTVYASVVNSAGLEVGRSADKVLAAGDLDKFVTFTIDSPIPTFTNEEFYVGLAVPANTSTTSFFPMGTQTEDAARSGAYYNAPITGVVVPTDRNDVNRFLIEIDIAEVIIGTKEQLANNAIAVYPNPSNGNFRIQFSDLNSSSAKSVEIRNINGQLVYSGTANAAAEAMNVSVKNLAAGVYILQVKSDTQLAVKRLVIE